jgi:plasmid stabilization system protein ParE
MNTPIRLLPEAREEYDAAADWDEAKQAGLGVDFIARVRAVFERISTNPRIHAKVYGDVRKAVVKRFPYIIPYREDADEVIVVSVFHTSRDPSIWQARA